MKFLFQLPTWLGIVIVVVFVVVAGLLAITQTRKRIQQHFTKQHEKVGRLLFRTSAGVIALLISLSYANGRIEQNKLRDTMELEASLIVNVFAKLQIKILLGSFGTMHIVRLLTFLPQVIFATFGKPRQTVCFNR